MTSMGILAKEVHPRLRASCCPLLKPPAEPPGCYPSTKYTGVCRVRHLSNFRPSLLRYPTAERTDVGTSMHLIVMASLPRPSVLFPLAAAALWLTWILYLAAYRLFFHPLARFPGPKLAALTKWYEFYYDVICRGHFTFNVQDMHKKYGCIPCIAACKHQLTGAKGPIVRITPDELHIEDSDYWATLYAQSSRFEKYEWMAGRFGNNGSIFTTSHPDLHRLRRSALSSLFSKRSIVEFQPVIRDKIEIFCTHLAEYGKNGKVVDMKKAWSAFAGDVVCQYAFGYTYNNLESADFSEGFHDAFMAMSEFGLMAMQLPWVAQVSLLT